MELVAEKRQSIVSRDSGEALGGVKAGYPSRTDTQRLGYAALRHRLIVGMEPRQPGTANVQLAVLTGVAHIHQTGRVDRVEQERVLRGQGKKLLQVVHPVLYVRLVEQRSPAPAIRERHVSLEVPRLARQTDHVGAYQRNTSHKSPGFHA